jgi:thymidine kinase
VTEGDQVVIGDTADDDGPADDVPAAPTGAVAYEVLCRRHHMRHMTAATARRRSAPTDSLWS